MFLLGIFLFTCGVHTQADVTFAWQPGRPALIDESWRRVPAAAAALSGPMATFVPSASTLSDRVRQALLRSLDPHLISSRFKLTVSALMQQCSATGAISFATATTCETQMLSASAKTRPNWAILLLLFRCLYSVTRSVVYRFHCIRYFTLSHCLWRFCAVRLMSRKQTPFV